MGRRRVVGVSINQQVLCPTGSSNGHSPVLNLSKSGGGSGGEHSGSEAGHTAEPEDEEDDENVSDVDEDDDKDAGEDALTVVRRSNENKIHNSSYVSNNFSFMIDFHGLLLHSIMILTTFSKHRSALLLLIHF